MHLLQVADALDPLLVNDAALRNDIGMGKNQIQRFRDALAAAKGGYQLVASPLSGGGCGGEAAAGTARQPSMVEEEGEEVGNEARGSRADSETASQARSRAVRVDNLHQWEEEYDVAAAVAALRPPTPVAPRAASAGSKQSGNRVEDGLEPLTAGADLSLRPPSAFAVLSLQVRRNGFKKIW